MKFQQFKKFIVLMTTLLSLILLQVVGFADEDENVTEYVGPTKAMQVYANPVPNKQYTPPPASFYQYQSLDTERTTATDIHVTYIGAWSNEATSAFEYAASIWESPIASSVPIKIQVEF
ncbi:MAG: hypothetical protein DWQ04_32305, partial [Chloroflexi bacterium]